MTPVYRTQSHFASLWTFYVPLLEPQLMEFVQPALRFYNAWLRETSKLTFNEVKPLHSYLDDCP